MKKHLAIILMTAAIFLLFTPAAKAFAAEPALVEEDGKLHYYDESGNKVTNKCVLQIKDNGRDAYLQIDAEGNATKFTGTEMLAAKQLIKLKAVPADPTNSAKVTKCLKKAFKWSSKLPYVNISKKIKKDDKALEYYGTYGFTKDKGDCNVQAATFAIMAKVLGYDAKMVRGYVPQALKHGKPSKFGSHAWVTIKSGKKNYVYDPNFEGTHHKGWKFKYGAKKHYRYFSKKKKEIKK